MANVGVSEASEERGLREPGWLKKGRTPSGGKMPRWGGQEFDRGRKER